MDAKETITYLYEHGHIPQTEHFQTIYRELNKPVTKHPDVQRLVGQVVELQAENKGLKIRSESRFNDWLIACGMVRKLQAENERLKEAIDVSLYAIKNLGAGGHAETPLLVLKPERGDNAVILATYMPHSGADTTLQYLQRECVRPMEQALKGQTHD